MCPPALVGCTQVCRSLHHGADSKCKRDDTAEAVCANNNISQSWLMPKVCIGLITLQLAEGYLWVQCLAGEWCLSKGIKGCLHTSVETSIMFLLDLLTNPLLGTYLSGLFLSFSTQPSVFFHSPLTHIFIFPLVPSCFWLKGQVQTVHNCRHQRWLSQVSNLTCAGDCPLLWTALNLPCQR